MWYVSPRPGPSRGPLPPPLLLPAWPQVHLQPAFVDSTMSDAIRDPALDGESRVGEIIAILSVASVLSTLVVALRCYCRAVILRNFGIDDMVIVPAQVNPHTHLLAPPLRCFSSSSRSCVVGDMAG